MTETNRDAKRRSMRYSRMFSALAFGLLFVITGLLGYDLRADHSTGLSGNERTDGPILRQVAIGVGLLCLGVFWSKRLADPRLGLTPPAARLMKHAGAGRSPGASMTNRQQLNAPDDESRA
jgi:hypothetical protein